MSEYDKFYAYASGKRIGRKMYTVAEALEYNRHPKGQVIDHLRSEHLPYYWAWNDSIRQFDYYPKGRL